MTIEPLRVDFVSIPVRDKDAAARFYEETLGFERVPRATHGWPEYRVGEAVLAIVVPSEIGMEFVPTPPGQIAIRVADVAEARAKLERSGVEFAGETYDSGVCHLAFFKDPDGNGLMLHHRYAPFDDGSLP